MKDYIWHSQVTPELQLEHWEYDLVIKDLYRGRVRGMTPRTSALSFLCNAERERPEEFAAAVARVRLGVD